MLPDDATGSVYQGATVHISRPPSASAMLDAASVCIDKGKSRGTNTFVEKCCFMRRDAARSTSLRTGYISSDAVSDGLWNRFLADARNDSEDPLFQILRFAQNDNVLLLRMTMYCCSE